MKTLKRILLFIAGICLFIACSKSDHFWGDESLGNTMKNGKAMPVMVTVPFKTAFVYNYTAILQGDPLCSADQYLRIIGDGSGTGTHLGKFTSHVDFCATETGFGTQGSKVGSFVAANGDELFFTTWGEGEAPNGNDPPYILWKWDAPFLFISGTGRFEGATGEGRYKGYNYMESNVLLCHAIFEGTLTMVKGK